MMTNHVRRMFAAFLLLLAGNAAHADDTLDRLASDALDRLNVRRAQVGLPPLQRNAVLDRSAAAHASYLTRNNALYTDGHGERAGKPGYSGETPGARMMAAGYTGSSMSENLALTSYPLGSLSTDNLIDAPYHRQAQFGAYREAGVAMRTQAAQPGSINPQHYIYVINFGGSGKETVKDKQGRPFVYPTHGQTDAPADWIAIESPNPVPELNGQRVGYPISISADPGDKLRIDAFSLSSAGGEPVSGRLITTRTDDGKPLDSYAFWIPLKPLAFGASYKANARGALNETAFSLQWQFTTRPASPLQLHPSAKQMSSIPGSTVSVSLSGGTGSSLAVNYSGHRYQFYGKTNPKVSFVTANHVAPDTVILTRNETPCARPVTACEIMVKGKDSSGNEVNLTLPVN